jgi:AcrR family transcriptional regulator
LNGPGLGLRRPGFSGCGKQKWAQKLLDSFKRLFHTDVLNSRFPAPMTNRNAVHDNETRDRVWQAAARLFAERGFSHVSVRDICREAGSNVASVNYHFGDKLGLYRELIGTIAEGMKCAKLAASEPAAAETPEDRLRVYVRHYLHLLFEPAHAQDAWMEALIAREMTEPTAALDWIIEKGIRPASDALSQIVGEILGLPASDHRVQLGSASIQGLCTWFHSTRAVAVRLVPGLEFTPQVIDGIATFIVTFSLGGLGAVKPEPTAGTP